MAMLWLDRDESCIGRAPDAGACSLRDWLGGGWGLLFSHPDDFAQYDVESDRWLVLLQAAFDAARVRPIALAPGLRPSARKDPNGWLAEVCGGLAPTTLANAHFAPRIADFRLHALREAITRSSSRFVMIIDADLHLRRTFAYAAQDRLPSLFDLIATAEKVRSRTRRAINGGQRTADDQSALGAPPVDFPLTTHSSRVTC